MQETMLQAKQVRDNFWHLLCHRTELPATGHFIKLDWLGQEVVVYNDDGDFVVFDNLCPHRGTRFFTEPHGIGRISCSYHGWSYQKGAMHIPCREKYPADKAAQATLRKLKVDWCADFLFVGISPQLPLEDQLGDELYEQLANISFNINGRLDFNTDTYECDWRIAIENALEPLHLDYIHPNTLGAMDLGDGINKLFDWASVYYLKVRQARMERQLKGMGKLFQIDYQHEGYLAIYMFPFTMLTSTFGYSYSLQNFFPKEQPNQTHFYSRLLKGIAKSPQAEEILQGFFESTARVNRQVFVEDRDICQRVSPVFVNDTSLGVLADEEIKLDHFRDCLARSAKAAV